MEESAMIADGKCEIRSAKQFAISKKVLGWCLDTWMPRYRIGNLELHRIVGVMIDFLPHSTPALFMW